MGGKRKKNIGGKKSGNNNGKKYGKNEGLKKSKRAKKTRKPQQDTIMLDIKVCEVPN